MYAHFKKLAAATDRGECSHEDVGKALHAIADPDAVATCLAILERLPPQPNGRTLCDMADVPMTRKDFAPTPANLGRHFVETHRNYAEPILRSKLDLPEHAFTAFALDALFLPDYDAVWDSDKATRATSMYKILGWLRVPMDGDFVHDIVSSAVADGFSNMEFETIGELMRFLRDTTRPEASAKRARA